MIHGISSSTNKYLVMMNGISFHANEYMLINGVSFGTTVIILAWVLISNKYGICNIYGNSIKG